MMAVSSQPVTARPSIQTRTNSISAVGMHLRIHSRASRTVSKARLENALKCVEVSSFKWSMRIVMAHSYTAIRAIERRRGRLQPAWACHPHARKAAFCFTGFSGVGLGMNTNKTALERAFELAKSGKYANVSDIKNALLAERYSTEKVTGASLSKQLRDLIASSR